MTMRTFLNLWYAHPGARFALVIAALAVWLAWSLRAAPPVHPVLPAQSAPAAAASPVVVSPPVKRIYKCVTRGRRPEYSESPCPRSSELQMVEIPPSPGAVPLRAGQR